MPDLGNIVSMSSSSLTLTRCSNHSLDEPTPTDIIKKSVEPKAKNVEFGLNMFLPFLVGAPKLPECRVCEKVIYPGEEVSCDVHDCKGSYHLTCARNRLGLLPSSKTFRCPQHVCYLCKKRFRLRRCSICHLASHDKCAAFPKHVLHSKDFPSKIICWKHHWPPSKPADPINSIAELFGRLPLPYTVEEFKTDLAVKDAIENKLEPTLEPTPYVHIEKKLEPTLEPTPYVHIEKKLEPTPYVHIRRNIYHVKKKRDDTYCNAGCTDCSSSSCSQNCVCRLQCISCSKACRCSDKCTNKPFRKEKKIKVVLTEHCGWGVEAAESIKKGEFIIEYVGEVISDAMCEQRLWGMKHQGIKNFYMCEIRKNFTIDATEKGNASRFLNHSCGPNCNLEKWHVDGETRVGVFAARSIKAGEPLTYDYRFVQFGPEVKCNCGASNCQGYLGTKKKTAKLKLFNWGVKRRRTATANLRIIKT